MAASDVSQFAEASVTSIQSSPRDHAKASSYGQIRGQYTAVVKGRFAGSILGPEGMVLADLLAFAHEDARVTGVNWHITEARLTALGKRYLRVSPAATRNQRNSLSGKNKTFISDVLVPLDSSSFHVALAQKSKHDVLYKVKLKCGGGGDASLGKPTGATCTRNPAAGGGFCSGTGGKCSSGCSWLDLKGQYKRDSKLAHMCTAEIVITSTCWSYLNGRARYVTFNIEAHSTGGWRGTSADAQKPSESTVALAERLACQPQSAGDVQVTVATLSPNAKRDKRAMSGPQIKKMQQNIRRSIRGGNGSGLGDWARLVLPISNHVIRSNITRFDAGLPFILYYNSSPSTMQLVASRKDALAVAFNDGSEYVQTDAKNDWNRDHCPVSAVIARTKLGQWEMLVLSLASSESSRSISIMIAALQHAVPCSPTCDHGIDMVTNSEGAFIFFRRCRGPPFSTLEGTELAVVSLPSGSSPGVSSSAAASSSSGSHVSTMHNIPPAFNPMVGIDQCSKAKKALESRSMALSLCAFHVYKSLDEHGQSKLKFTSGEAAVVGAGAHLVLRARTPEHHQEVLQALITEVSSTAVTKIHCFYGQCSHTSHCFACSFRWVCGNSMATSGLSRPLTKRRSTSACTSADQANGKDLWETTLEQARTVRSLSETGLPPVVRSSLSGLCTTASFLTGTGIVKLPRLE